MANFLRDVLRRLCGGNKWSYAVFWKFGCQNPKLLIWEECHFEQSPCLVRQHPSGIENQDPFGEWGSYWAASMCSSQLGIQAEDRVRMLINKMMMNNQINVVGEGLVGRAAFTGNHQWILANNYVGDTHPPEVLNEVRQQCSAGMQTIAVIPVCPHGVVQLGSSLAIMENVDFVNTVKSFILKLGHVSGALMSDSSVEKDSVERLGVPVSLGMPGHSTGNHNVSSSCPSLVDSYNQQNFLCNTLKFAGQPSCSQVRQSWDNPQHTMVASSNLTKGLAKSSDGNLEPKVTFLMKPEKTFRGQPENGGVGGEPIPSNLYAPLNQQPSSYYSVPGFSHPPVIVQPDANNRILTLLKQQILSNARAHNHATDNKDVLGTFTLPDMRMNGSLIVNAHEDIVKTNKESSAIMKQCNSGGANNSSVHLVGVALQNVDSSKAEEVPLSNSVNQINASGILSGGSDHKYCSTDVNHLSVEMNSKNESTSRKERMHDDLVQALDILLTQQNTHLSLDNHVTGSAHDCLEHASGSLITNTAISENGNLCMQSASGNDLYDILGVDFKNKLLNNNSNLPAEGQYVKTQNIDKDASTFMNMQEACSDFYSVDNGMSDSGIFSSVGTDNLLDAVVSRGHSATKQNSDDNVSCRTTLTKISSASIASGSDSHGHASMSDQLSRDMFDLPKSLGKAGNIASSSLKSGCSKEDIGSCSQTSSIYGSQLSAWVGHHVKRDSNVSTAFSKKNSEVSKPNRKRPKPGENPRPRPKDRQMIQDRVKELREIVPNGAKCSIDALLERTIKHMLFLQSVTKHADKLKQTGDSKIINKDGGPLLKDNFEGGATWAFEVGSQSMVCPIIVEDLNQPRQMLVEMLCEERGFFLEIADLIRGLGLTILKGVMEARDGKIWARFAVEANRDVTRMEIFMSLVCLLEQTVKGSISSANALENNNMMIHPSFAQATPITATGRPDCLQ